MDKNKKKTQSASFIDAKRRGFLQGSALATGAVATGAVSADMIASESAIEHTEPRAAAGYKLSDKVKKYYSKARF